MAPLGQLLLERDWITGEQLEAALKRQHELGGRLGTTLLEIGALSEDLLVKTLAEQLEVPLAGVEDLRKIPSDVHELLPAKLAIRHLAIPFRAGSSHVDVATLKVKDLEALDELAFVLGKRTVVHIANEARIFEALEKYYGKECPVRMRSLLDRLNRHRDRWKTAQPPPAKPPKSAPARAAPRRAPAAVGGGRPSAPRGPAPAPVPAPRAEVTLASPGGASAARPTRPAASSPAAPAPAHGTPDRSGAPPAPRSQPPRSVPLTSAERNALRGAGHDARTGPRPQSEILSLEEMEARLESVRSTDEVGATLLDFLSQEFIRTFLFRVKKDHIEAWLGRGPRLDEAAFRGYRARFDEPSLFLNLHRGGEFFLGVLPRMPAHRRLVACWGGDLGNPCCLFPIRLRDHLVSVVYGDRDALGLDGLDLKLLQRVAAKAAIAFEMCIMRKKLRKA